MFPSPKIRREKNEALARFLGGYVDAMAVIRRDKETTMKSMGKFLKTNDREVLESVYDDYKDVFPQVPLMTAAEIKAVIDVAKIHRAKQMKSERYLDKSCVYKTQATSVC